ncbi:MAG: hypothetical protein FWH22_06930 [Fibromonadales bacterium]|nr:hypothetical protein [Fibromonadales bacterium]
MQHDTPTRKITRLAKQPNMGGYINVNNRDTHTLGISLVNSRRLVKSENRGHRGSDK